MKNVKTNVGSFAMTKLQAKMLRILAIIALVAVMGLSFVACDNGNNDYRNYGIETNALNAVIQEAVNARDGVAKASNASEVPTGKFWVTESEWNAFDAIYKAAVETKTNPSSQQAVDTVKTNLQAAIITFNAAKKAGSAAAITLSGTITVRNNGQTVPYVEIHAHTDDWNWQETVKIPSPAANTPWSIITKPFSDTTDISFDISGYDNDKYENALFTELTADVKKMVYNTDVNNIAINMDLNFITISGTLNLNYGKVIPSVRIDINRKGGNNVRLGAVNLLNVGNNTQWSTIIPSQTIDTDVIFNIVGFAGPIPYEYDQLFALWEKDFGVKVKNQNKTGIALNLITIGGTVNVTYNGGQLPIVVIHIFQDSDNDDEREWIANTEILTPSANTAWSLVIPAFTVNTEIFVGVEGKNGNGQLFWWWYDWDNETKIFAKDRNITIPLNLGNIEGDDGENTTFTSITDFATWLAGQPNNNINTPYNIKLNIGNLTGLLDFLKGLPGKFINLDLSGSTLTTIPVDAFRECASLTGVIIPNGVTSIGSAAFYNCTSLSDITIPNGVTGIGNSAFGRTKLTSITIPSSVTSITGYAFDSCTSLTAIIVNANNASFSSDNGILYNKNKTTLVAYPAGKTGNTFTIPNSVTSIGAEAFAYSNLTSMILPSRIISIGASAFYGCTNLISVTFNSTISLDNNNYSFTGDLDNKYLAGGIGTYTTTAPVSSSSVWTKQGGGGSVVMNGTWNRINGSYTYSILISGNDWTFSENNTGIFKGTWTSTVTPAAPSSGNITLKTTHQNSSGGWISIPAGYESVATNTAAFSINSTGTQMTITNSANANAEFWGKTEGTYIKDGGTGNTPVSYIITGSGTSFTAAKNGVTVGTANQTIDNVITAIKTDANGANVAIQFGNGTNVLDIGTSGVQFANSGGTWGNIAISGKITSSVGTISITNVSITSTADITSTYTSTTISNNYAIYNSGSTVTITSGTVSATGSGSTNGIYNSGTLTINGGTVSVTHADSNNGIYNYNGTVIINNGTVSVTKGDGIRNSGSSTVTVKGGNVQSVSGRAINSSGGSTVTITGGTVSSSSTSNAITCDGTLNISNGTIKSTNTNGTAIQTDNSCTATISGGTIESPQTAILNGGTLNMTGGTVTATGTGVSTCAISNVGSTAILTITGGTVSAPNAGSNGYAIRNASGGTVTITSPPAVINGKTEGINGNNSEPTAWTAVADSKFGTSDINAIAYSNNRFVAVGENGKMATSTDGTAWTAVDVSSIFGSYSTIYKIAFGNNKFVAAGGKMATSTDGTAWTAINVSSIFGTNSTINTITYVNNKFIAASLDSEMATSTNGTTWTAVNVSSIFKTEDSDFIYAIAYGNNKFVAAGSHGKMATSTDGTTWTAVGNSTFGTDIIWAIAYGNNKFVAVGNNGKMATSTDGTAWTAITTNTFGTNNINAIAYGNNKFVAGGSLGKMAYSSGN